LNINFSEYAKLYKPKIDEILTTILETKLKEVNNSFLKSYYSELKNYLLSGGKRIRPLLTIAAYNAFSKKNEEKIILPSTGMEFLHNASLIHDDIIDKDDFRRGSPAFHYRFKKYHENYSLKKMVAKDFGTSIGIIGGNTTFFLGLEPYLINDFDNQINYKAIELYKKAFVDVIEGVLIEIDMINQTDISIEDYIKMISLKTGALIEKAMVIGVNYANTDEKYIPMISKLGINFGIIFQIIDDILGTFGNEKITGKPTDGDIREGKKTCLLIISLHELSENKKTRLLDLIENPEMSEKDISEVKKLFNEADVQNKCKNIAKKYYNESKDILEKLKSNINPSELEFFESLLNFIMDRSF